MGPPATNQLCRITPHLHGRSNWIFFLEKDMTRSVWNNFHYWLAALPRTCKESQQVSAYRTCSLTTPKTTLFYGPGLISASLRRITMYNNQNWEPTLARPLGKDSENRRFIWLLGLCSFSLESHMCRFLYVRWVDGGLKKVKISFCRGESYRHNSPTPACLFRKLMMIYLIITQTSEYPGPELWCNSIKLWSHRRKMP